LTWSHIELDRPKCELMYDPTDEVGMEVEKFIDTHGLSQIQLCKMKQFKPITLRVARWTKIQGAEKIIEFLKEEFKVPTTGQTAS
jgi:hypothetical protein